MAASARRKGRSAGCPICRHPLTGDIDARLRAPRQTAAGVAKFYGLPYKQVQRHRNNCLPKQAHHIAPVDVFGPDHARLEPTDASAGTVEEQAATLFRRAQKLITDAEFSGRAADMRGAIRECRQTLEFVGRLKGQLDQSASLAMFSSPAWLAVRTRIIEALEPHPLARAAVVRALQAPVAA